MEGKQLLKKYFIVILLLSAFVLRLYGFSNPIADWHSWRQADTSAVSRNFVKLGYDVLHPRFDDLSNVASGMDNPNGYRFVEFPLYNLLQAGVFQLFGVFTIEEWGRLVTIFFSLLTLLFIYLQVKKYAGERAGLISAGIYAFLPFTIYYGRVILPDPAMVACSAGAIYFFDLWMDDKKLTFSKSFVLSTLFAIAALLFKPYAIFFIIPMGFLAVQRYKLAVFSQWRLWVYGVLIVTPLVLWRLWITQFPEGIPANSWLLNGNGIRFRPAFFRWIIYERLVKLISGYWGMIFFVFGAYRVLSTRKLWFFVANGVRSVLYVVIFATGNVQHDYYQILIMPTVVMILGLGADWIIALLNKNRRFPLGEVVVGLIFCSMIYLSWQQIKGYFYINNPSMIIAGKVVDEITPKDAKIVALYDGDTSFLYQTNRQGWPTLQNGLDDLIQKGADYLVFANPTPDNYKLGAPYKIVSERKEYVIFDLHEKR